MLFPAGTWTTHQLTIDVRPVDIGGKWPNGNFASLHMWHSTVNNPSLVFTKLLLLFGACLWIGKAALTAKQTQKPGALCSFAFDNNMPLLIVFAALCSGDLFWGWEGGGSRTSLSWQISSSTSKCSCVWEEVPGELENKRILILFLFFRNALRQFDLCWPPYIREHWAITSDEPAHVGACAKNVWGHSHKKIEKFQRCYRMLRPIRLQPFVLFFSFFSLLFLAAVTPLLIWKTFNKQTYKWNITLRVS